LAKAGIRAIIKCAVTTQKRLEKKFKALKNTFAGFFEISKNSFLVKKLYESFEKLSFKNLYTAFLKNFSATFQKLFFAKKVL
jgi:hypothetical protein